MRRAIERLLTRPLSAALLEEQFRPGDTVLVKAQEGRLHLERQPKTAPTSA
ncbi:MAG: hypothetical protein HC915_13430 [Anaerolineae bacterium]|nr:hypothetical protein [Anaerolineae bacterium]